VKASDDFGATQLDPDTAPESQYSYTIGQSVPRRRGVRR
jgi:hypothetical protein